MKKSTVSVWQKLIVVVLAVLLFITMIPVGLLPKKDDFRPEGSFVRLMPEAEVYAETANRQTRQIDRYKSVYLKFDIREMAELQERDINEITLRLVFLKGGGEKSGTVYVNAVDPGSMPHEAMGLTLIRDKDTEIAEICPDNLWEEDFLYEGDVREYIIAAIAEGKEEVAFRITTDADNPMLMASKEHLDVAYRPCLKVVTGAAEDTDADTVKKAELYDGVYVSDRSRSEAGKSLAEKSGCLLIGDGNETYLRFRLNKNAIVGSLYSARILLNLTEGTEISEIRVYSLNNDEWSGDSIKYNDRPRGEEKTLTYAEINNNSATIDVTQQVCEAVNNGMYDITFRLVGTGKNTVRVHGMGDKTKQPRLTLKATDDKNIVCASEAALNALGNNNDKYVTMNLLGTYIASNGEKARIRWKEYSESENLAEIPRYIEEDGEIIRPKWFENAANTLVMAEIKSGDYVTKRRYEINLPSEKKPDYTGYKFGSYVDIGDDDSEEKQKFEFVNMSGIRRRWIDGKIFTYRTPEKNCVMVLNLECSPYEENYITLKLRQGDAPSPGKICIKPYGYKGEELVLEIPEFEEEDNGDVLYLTHALPEDFTGGSRSVTLCVRFEDFKDQPSRGVYGAYMTQSPYFEPGQFRDQGESVVSGEPFGGDGAEKFIGNLKKLFGMEEEQDTDGEVSAISLGDEKPVVLSGKELNIAVIKNRDDDTVSVYQKTDYFDRYCKDVKLEKRSNIRIVKYGIYTIIINRNQDKEYDIGFLNLGLEGVYKNMSDGEYYIFSVDNDVNDISIIPDNRIPLRGEAMKIPPESAVILKQISGPYDSDGWQVSEINGRSVAEITFDETEKIGDISVRAPGIINGETESIKVICGIYENGKLTGMGMKEEKVFEGISRYRLNFEDDNLYMNKNRSIKIFVTENDDNLNKLMPRLELPL